jgi:hypothetical protein
MANGETEKKRRDASAQKDKKQIRKTVAACWKYTISYRWMASPD